jgi:sugar phosphate isomerase/epimerase
LADLDHILTSVDSPPVARLWDAHHSFVAAREQPADTLSQTGRWVRHTHLKDPTPEGSDRRCVRLGAGEVPVEEEVRVPAASGDAGFCGFEWEKMTMAGYLVAAGVKSSRGASNVQLRQDQPA